MAPNKEPRWVLDDRASLGRYYLAVNPGWSYVKYQQEIIIPAVEQLERGDFNRLMIFIHAGASKTEIATKAFIPWFLGQQRNKGKNVGLITRAADLALSFGSHIRDVMMRPIYKQIFPWCQLDKASRAKNYFKTTMGQEFMAFGVDGQITGRRMDLCVCEDWVANFQEAYSEDVQRHLYDDIYKGVVRDRLRPGGKLLFITTRWGVRDVAARILDDEGERWMVLVIKAQEHIDGCIDKAIEEGVEKPAGTECKCPYLWEEHFGRKFYDEFKEDRQLWLAKWQQSPRPIQNQGFREEWLRFWLHDGARAKYRDDPEGGQPTLIAAPVDTRKLYKFNAYIFVDPALGKEATHDRTSIWVILAGPEGRLFIVDGVLDRLDPGERIQALISLCRKWRPKFIYYEEYGMANDAYFLTKALEAQGLAALPGMDSGGAVVTAIGRKGQQFSGGRLKKADRIMQLTTDFRDGRIWLPVRLEKTLLDGTKFDIVTYFVNREYLPYAGEGSVAHDDALDCLSRVRDPEVVMEHVERESEDDEEDYYGGDSGGGSWEGRY